MTQDEPEYFVGEEQESLETNVDILILEEDDLKVGLTFETEDAAVRSILKWSELTFCPLSKARYQKPKMKEHGERIKCFHASFLMIQEPDTVSNDSHVDCDDCLASPGMVFFLIDGMLAWSI